MAFGLSEIGMGPVFRFWLIRTNDDSHQETSGSRTTKKPRAAFAGGASGWTDVELLSGQ